MIDTEMVKENYKKYINKFNLTDDNINRKKFHQLRAEEFKIFNDCHSFYYGDYGAEVLRNNIRNFVYTDKFDNIIIKAVKKHNKLNIKSNLKEQFYTRRGDFLCMML